MDPLNKLYLPTEGEMGEVMKRAGSIISCGFHVFAAHSKSKDKWMTSIIFEDMDGKQFAYHFRLDEDEPLILASLLLKSYDAAKELNAMPEA